MGKTVNDYRKLRYERRKAAGQCTACGKSDSRTLSGKIRCESCAAKGGKSNDMRYQKLRNAQLCTCCGKQDRRTIAGKTCCFNCAVKNAEMSKHSREKRKAAAKVTSDAGNNGSPSAKRRTRGLPVGSADKRKAAGSGNSQAAKTKISD